MASNSISATGNIVMDPQEFGSKGAAKARIVITDDYGDQKASFADLVLFKNEAQYLLKYGAKGRPFTVTGATLQVRQYETEKGRGTAVELVGGRLTLPKVETGASGGTDEETPF